MNCKALGAAIIAAGLVSTTTGQALAAPASSAKPASSAVARQISLTADTTQVAKARTTAAAARRAHHESTALADLRHSMEKKAAKAGTTYLDADTESFSLSSDVSMAVPRGLAIKSVKISTVADKVVAEVESEEGPDQLLAPQGTGMGWNIITSGTFVIKISGEGEMESHYLKRRMDTSTYDYIAYRRTGLGQPYEIGGLNYSVTGLYISTHATDATAGHILDRIDQSPSTDFSGNCSGSYDISVSVLGVGAGGSFADCDHYDVAWSSSEPGYYRNYMEQGASFSGGNRSVGFQIALRIKKDTSLSFTNYQKLEMARWIYPADTCSSWDADHNC